MADALTYIAAKYGVTLSQREQPIEIPNTNRESLARLFHLLGFTKGAEIGVERGHYSEILCRENSGVQLACVDAWKAYRGYRDHVDQAKLDRFFDEARQRLQPYRVTFVRKFSVDAALDFADGELDFVYLDGNHRLEQVMADLAAWSPKVRVGGIVAGHDYIKAKLPSLMHVPQAIHAWIDCYQIAPLFVLGRRAKVEGELRDDGRSWFYVKPEPAPASRKVIKQ
jgi:hypothetical protein